MNKLDIFKESIKNKNITVIGIGISNIPLIRFLVQNGAVVTACDKRPKPALDDELAQLSDVDIKYHLGENYLQSLDADIIFKTPGMRFDVPQLLRAKEQGSVVTSEMEVFFDLCPANITAVTGSDGKTTTTTLISEMLKEQGRKVWLGGNIGNPLLAQIGDITPDDDVVLELSSFQLHTMKVSPHIAVITNISPNHLDMHKDMEEYIQAKKNIMRYQHKDSVLVYNCENDITNQIGQNAKGSTVSFGKSSGDFYIEDSAIYLQGKRILGLSDIKIPGLHNVENFMAAMGAVIGRVSYDTMRHVAKNFCGVEHRCEFVREVDGVRYYNSSIDSSPNRTKHTAAIFDKKIILISGGKDKGIPYDEIGPVIAQHVKNLILIGATADKIDRAVKDTGACVETLFCDTYEQVVMTAHSLAEPGDIVLLSPASTSFDMFKNFEQRGNLFKELVNGL